MKDSNPQRDALEIEYTRRHRDVLVSLSERIAHEIDRCIAGQARVDRVSARAKSVDRFLKKASTTDDGKLKYDEPLSQIQDQIGARIVVFYKSDVERIETQIKKHFTAIEYKAVVPDSESEFGYFGRHLILVVPSDVVTESMDPKLLPPFFELQIKTLFQHAWSEADHDLGYKPGETELTADQKRLVAFTSAQAWGADHIFDQLFIARSA